MLRKFFLITVIAALLTLSLALTACGSGRNLNGRWMQQHGDSAYEFSRNNFTRWHYTTIPQYFGNWEYVGDGMYRARWGTGTFSISTQQQGNQIEFVYDNGNIRVHNFSQTENTITIGHFRYVRR